MRKLILILLTFIAVFTYIRAFEKAGAKELTPDNTFENPTEIPVEIVR
jgi:hypothetical protein